MKKQYNLIKTLEMIQNDIQDNRLKILALGLFSFVTSIVLIPFLLWIIITFLQFADLPMVDHSLLYHTLESNSFFLACDITLFFYFLLVIKMPLKQENEYKNNLKISLLFFLFTIGISFFPYLINNHILTGFLYSIFFLVTLFFISKTFYCKKHKQLFGGYEEGYMGFYGGLGDDPFTIKDDINRAKLSLDGIFAGFNFLFFFFEQTLASILFFYSIYKTDNTIESAELFNYILENNLESQTLDKHFSIYSKNILETIEYVLFNEYVIFLSKGKKRSLEIIKANKP